MKTGTDGLKKMCVFSLDIGCCNKGNNVGSRKRHFYATSKIIFVIIDHVSRPMCQKNLSFFE